VAAIKAGSYEERPCSRCFEGRLYDLERGAWVACERCSGTGRVEGSGLRLPLGKALLTVERRVTHFMPEFHCQGSGLCVAEWVLGMSSCIIGCAHPSEKSAAI
jgi:hypothetical protein